MVLIRAIGRVVVATLLGVIMVPSTVPLSGAAVAKELRISHQFNAQVDSRDLAARVFVDEVGKRAPHLQFKIYPALSFGIESAAQFDAMARGDLEMSVYTLTYAVSKVPELAIAWFPFIPADIDMAVRLKGSPFHRQLQSLAEANGVHLLTWWWLPGGVATRKSAIGGPQTVKDVGFRFPDASYERLFMHAGARKAPFVATPAVPAAMRDGKLDGVMTAVESLVSFRIYEHAKHATFGGVGSMMTLMPLAISKMTWDGLTVDEQVAFEEAAEVSDRFFEATQRDVEQKAREAFTKAGGKVHQLSLDEYEAWSRIAKDKIWADYRKISPTADALFVALVKSVIQAGKAGR
jgi:TRAP-type C4-dicarboxylate transport system substrate-binding protein